MIDLNEVRSEAKRLHGEFFRRLFDSLLKTAEKIKCPSEWSDAVQVIRLLDIHDAGLLRLVILCDRTGDKVVPIEVDINHDGKVIASGNVSSGRLSISIMTFRSPEDGTFNLDWLREISQPEMIQKAVKGWGDSVMNQLDGTLHFIEGE